MWSPASTTGRHRLTPDLRPQPPYILPAIRRQQSYILPAIHTRIRTHTGIHIGDLLLASIWGPDTTTAVRSTIMVRLTIVVVDIMAAVDTMPAGLVWPLTAR